VSVVFIFADCPPDELLKLKCFVHGLASMADCQCVEKVDNIETYIEDKFTKAVGD